MFVSQGKTEYVNAWMESEDKHVNIILVDWTDLSHAGEIVFWETLEVNKYKFLNIMFV